MVGQLWYYVFQMFIGMACVTSMANQISLNLGPQLYMDVFCLHFDNYFEKMKEIISLNNFKETKNCLIDAIEYQLKIGW